VGKFGASSQWGGYGPSKNRPRLNEREEPGGSELTGKRKQDAFLAAMQIKRVERPRPRGHGAERRDSPGQPAKVGMARDGWSRGRDRSTRRVGMVFGANKTWFADQPENRAFSLRESCACPSEFWWMECHAQLLMEIWQTRRAPA
jgi:hypothetical protein